MDITITKKLESSKSEILTDQNFKLYAGPGAGKTTFLTAHIKRIIRTSTRLNKNRKIACITYTNTAVTTLKNKLEGCELSVEICTIHSFCYNFIVKPFIWVLSDCIIPPEKINGHEEIKLRKSQLTEFKRITNQFHLDEKPLSKVLGKLTWFLDNDELTLRFPNVYDGKIGDYNLKKSSFSIYKELYWAEGKLSHDDVLYFAYRILKEKNEVLRVLRARFPYILIDEFQDTSPIQTAIIKLIGEVDTTVGVIGDVCQSIYSFQGANVKLFKEFSLGDMKEYIIAGNRRSTEQIINVLNHMRGGTDFHQDSPENKVGQKPVIIISKTATVEKYLNELYGEVIYLSYKNSINEFPDILLEDANNDRSWMIYYVVQAVESVKELDMSNAIKFMKQAYRKNVMFDEKSALMNLKKLLSLYNVFENETITNFYNDYLVGHYEVKSRISRGNIKDYYDSLTFIQLVNQINKNDKSLLSHKTIHQSKGDEFETVCITFSGESKESNLEFLINPDMNKESHRVYYVALSRAMNNLFHTC
ncbi:UvrD-helicase domain-containing protein [Lysinibacillus xylanilyticus]|uniref:UvrD-helicase domain-containing protein n=1 Tax=Lysinibacillus xylanilyticus TaxID=582475 RepID=UPI003CFD889B